jgi:hypothetical protein
MAQFPPPPIITEFPQQGAPNIFSRPWIEWFLAITNKFNGVPFSVTGSRASGAALDSLLSQLATMGIIKNDSTP